jgi:ribosome-associated protein
MRSGQEVTDGDPACQPSRACGRNSSDLLRRTFGAKGGPLNIATLQRAPTPRLASALDRAILSARVAEDHFAKDVVVLDLRQITPLYDFLVLATGNSRRQIHTLAEEIDAALRAEGEQRLSIEGYEASKWVVQDYGDVVVHVFDPDTRTYYALEELWADAPRIDWQRG